MGFEMIKHNLLPYQSENGWWWKQHDSMTPQERRDFEERGERLCHSITMRKLETSERESNERSD
jgi:hypothetical protein